MTMDPETSVALQQINTKLDVLISQHGTVAGQVVDHEQRMRTLEARQVATDQQVVSLIKKDEDQEVRLRAADRWRYAMPTAAVGSVLAGGAAIIAALGH